MSTSTAYLRTINSGENAGDIIHQGVQGT